MVILKSDFRDYYDHWFDNKPPVYERYCKDSRSIGERFSLLDSPMGLQIPWVGLVDEAISRDKDCNYVVYTDEYSHCGEGKKLYSRQELLDQVDEWLICSEYIKDPEEVETVSYRWLVIGSKEFFLEYRGTDDWRSNCCSDLEIIESLDAALRMVTSKVNRSTIPVPMFAVDFVANGTQRKNYYAIDLNVAPGIKGTPIEDSLRSQEIVGLIGDWLKDEHH